MLAHFDDLTKINVPFGLLNDDTQQRLRECGAPWEIYYSEKNGVWHTDCNPGFFAALVHRKKPAMPKLRELWEVRSANGNVSEIVDTKKEAQMLLSCRSGWTLHRFIEAPEWPTS